MDDDNVDDYDDVDDFNEKAKVGEQARADGRGRDVQQRRVGNVFQEGQTTVCISRRF